MRPNVVFLDRQQVASRVIACGDPGRVRFYAENLLRDKVQISTDRDFAAFTGNYNGHELSVIQHGIGGPSTEVVIGDLPDSVKVLVRIGSGEANRPEMRKGDIVIPTKAIWWGGVIFELELAGLNVSTDADADLVIRLNGAASTMNLTRHDGKVFSSDTFFLGRTTPPERASVVDMETATVLVLGKLYDIKTAAVLLVNKNLVNEAGYDLAHKISDSDKLNVGIMVADVVTQTPISDRGNRISEFIRPDWKPRG